MSKILLSAAFAAAFAAFAMSPVAFASDKTLAEFHAEENDGCQTCHKEEKPEGPSADGAYEFEQCQSCHGGLAEMDAVHKPHDGELICSDCHAPHDHKMDQRPTCEACHDDGRTAESVMKQ